MTVRRAVTLAACTVAAASVCLGVLVERSTAARIGRVHAVELEALAVPETREGLARGRYLVENLAQCGLCHGADLSGSKIVDDPWMGRLYAPNLTPARGGLRDRSDAEIARAIRHGVRADGTSALMMPSRYYRALSGDDIGSIIAYLRTLPPVDREHPPRRVGPLTRLVVFAGAAPELLSAEWAAALEEDALDPPQPGPDAAYGAFVVQLAGCRICHSDDLSGGLHPLALPGEPVPSNLTPAGAIGGWSESDFVRALRTGITPDGRGLDAEFMPWPALAALSDLELRAVWQYLGSLPPRASR